MPGIAVIAEAGRSAEVRRMLDAMAFRGRGLLRILETEGATAGAVWAPLQPHIFKPERRLVQDFADDGRFARVRVIDGKVTAWRDPLGAVPLYWGRTGGGVLCFASEVKGLLTVTEDVREFPPGHRYDGAKLERYFDMRRRGPLLADPPDVIAEELRRRLDSAVQKCIGNGVLGCWLSGGLDSSALAALAQPYVLALSTFAGGLPGAPDLAFAREAANHLGTVHREVILRPEDMLRALPEVIAHLESFDALLVRSSVMNYLVAKEASNYVSAVLSGEAGDELFAGYEYLKTIPREGLADELIDIAERLHNTALQRVDRCASAHGLLVHTPFLDPAVINYAPRIPVEHKIRDGQEKWILRRAVAALLPPSVFNRPKVKFWQGTGVGDRLADHAEQTITDADFRSERRLPNGWTLNTKEELLYYRLFREQFGRAGDLSWMGRTKGAPRADDNPPSNEPQPRA